MSALAHLAGTLVVLAVVLALVALWAAFWGILWAGVSLWQLFGGE